MKASALLAIGVAAGLGCASHPERADWATEWNARVDGAADRMDHPCGDFAFDPWANAFLSDCEQGPGLPENECRARTDWVWERSRQCEVWQTWLLRNHNQRWRIDTSEPETRVD